MREKNNKKIENKINTSFKMFRAEDIQPESIVNKFIPFDDNGTTNL